MISFIYLLERNFSSTELGVLLLEQNKIEKYLKPNKFSKYFYSSLKSVQQIGKVGIKVSQIVLDIVKGSSQIEYFFTEKYLK